MAYPRLGVNMILTFLQQPTKNQQNFWEHDRKYSFNLNLDETVFTGFRCLLVFFCNSKELN